jgi:hypothetical protein
MPTANPTAASKKPQVEDHCSLEPDPPAINNSFYYSLYTGCILAARQMPYLRIIAAILGNSFNIGGSPAGAGA